MSKHTEPAKSHESTSKPEEKKHLFSHFHHHSPKLKVALTWIFATAAVVFVIGGIAIGVASGYARLYDHRIFPGVRILGVRMDGLTENEARIALNQQIDAALKDGLRFSYKGHEISLGATTVAKDDPDISSDLIRYQIDEPIQHAMEFGRSRFWIGNVLMQWKARMNPVTIETPLTLNEQAIKTGIEHGAEGISSYAKNAEIHLSWDAQHNSVTTQIDNEQDGYELQITPALKELWNQAQRLSFSPIQVSDKETNASLTRQDLEPLEAQADAWMKQAPFTLTDDHTTSVQIDASRFASWTSAEKDTNGAVRFTIQKDRFHTDIRELTHIEQEAKNGTLDIQDGKIVSFEAGTTGVNIDDDATIRQILSSLGTTTTIPLVIHRQEASLSGDDPEQMGIKEIIGIGTSDFSGSPANRTKNIANGVKHVNGTLIAPGAEFSMLKTLGEITAENGWLPELVIKGNKTLPELGGGLCQIGTTAFRAAMNSGLKITERQNHSYRVRYYEPAGTDATIYDPAPDFKFLNDTGHYILIHAYIKGTTITYEFWGTKDGRTASVPTPKVYNIVPPPPTKLVETLDLAPGKKNCTETAHAGADATLNYKVTYADGSTVEQVFNSHYRPWQAVCLIGVEKLSEPAAPTSTDSGTQGPPQG
jgi:vancomycin resistance protein YoaR